MVVTVMRYICCLLITYAVVQSASAAIEYTIKIADDLKSVDVTACFSGDPDDPHPRELYINSKARAAVKQLKWDNLALPKLKNWGPVAVGRQQRQGCLNYQAGLSDSGERWGYTSKKYTLTDPKHWLLAPPEGSNAIARFVVPSGVSVSHPWPLVDNVSDNQQQWFRLSVTNPHWNSNVAFGYFKIQTLPIDDTYLRLAVLPASPAPNMSTTRKWVQESAQAVLNAHGNLPQTHPQVLVMPVGSQNNAIPFGRVLRGGGIGLQFFIDPKRRLSEYSDDWVPTHEFSHLLLPYINRQDAWLSEGLASYYQNIMRARDGRLSEREAWDKLLAGFERGRRDVTSNRTLAEEASGMSRNGSYKRVYWSGAAMLFLADVELRKRTDGQHTLDTALAGIADCCMDVSKVWRARDMMRRMDAITGTDIFMRVYQQHTRSSEFPAVEQVLTDLGVRQRSGRVRLNNQAELAAIRKQIMRQPADQNS